MGEQVIQPDPVGARLLDDELKGCFVADDIKVFNPDFDRFRFARKVYCDVCFSRIDVEGKISQLCDALENNICDPQNQEFRRPLDRESDKVGFIAHFSKLWRMAGGRIVAILRFSRQEGGRAVQTSAESGERVKRYSVKSAKISASQAPQPEHAPVALGHAFIELPPDLLGRRSAAAANDVLSPVRSYIIHIHAQNP